MIGRTAWAQAAFSLMDAAVILLATQGAAVLRAGVDFDIFTIHTGASAFTLLFNLLTLFVFDLQNPRRDYRAWDSWLRVGLSVGSAGLLASILFYLFPFWKFGRGILGFQMALLAPALVGWRVVYASLVRSMPDREPVLVLGAGRAGQEISSLLEGERSLYRVVGYLDDDPAAQGATLGSARVLSRTDQLEAFAGSLRVRTAVLAIPKQRSPELVARLIRARLEGIRIIDMAALFEQLTGRVPVEYLDDDWLLVSDGFRLLSGEFVQKMKRLLDVGAALALLLVTAPLVILAAAAIRAESRGPVIFQQERVGMSGRIFRIWKFRSMRLDAEENGALWAEVNDPRVTRVGRVLRRFRIDELPQLLNVLWGDMSLVGPRPERPEFVRKLTQQIPYYSVRLAVPPGLTGWAQINYPYGASVEDAQRKLEYDLFYIKNMSLLLDLKILLRTIGVVLFLEGSR